MLAPSAERRAISLPFARALQDPRFRALIGLSLAAFGVAAYGLFLTILHNPVEPWVHDVEAYYQASLRAIAGLPLYSAAQVASPIDAICADCYLYPPPLAQVVAPLTVLPVEVVKVLWFMLQPALMAVAIWLATGMGGARRSVERAVWCFVAAAFFLPVFATGWLGNVSVLVALSVTLVALGGGASGFGAAMASLIKVVPATLIPAAFVADRRSRYVLVGSLVAITCISFVVTPGAWLDYPTVMRNMLAGSADYANNFAPSIVAARAGLTDDVAVIIRMVALAASAACVLLSVWLARKPGGMPAAALCGTVAMLLLPGALWYHYLAVLLPFAAMAWPGARGITRVGLVCSVALIVAGIGTPPLALIGSALLVAVSAMVLRPGRWIQASRPVSPGADRQGSVIDTDRSGHLVAG